MHIRSSSVTYERKKKINKRKMAYFYGFEKNPTFADHPTRKKKLFTNLGCNREDVTYFKKMPPIFTTHTHTKFLGNCLDQKKKSKGFRF